MPSFNKNNRRKTGSYKPLPKGAYVIKIMNAKEGEWQDGRKRLEISFDIAEGDYAGFYKKQWESSRETNPAAVWPYDAVYSVNIPDGTDERTQNNWDYFFVDVMDSNGGFEYGGDPKTLKGKIVGGKFRIRQKKANNGKVYDHTEMAWSCTVESVRDGKALEYLPEDKMVAGYTPSSPSTTVDANGFLDIADGADEDEMLPFD